jgi:hypothetical protein
MTLAQHCDLSKKGVFQLDEVGDYSVIVNKALFERDNAQKYAVASEAQDVVDSVHATPREARQRARQLK